MKKILIIEDEANQQEAYKQRLKGKYLLDFASTGGEVLSYIAPVAPNLIILDIMLPGGKNGFDILQSLKEDPKTKKIPVIMITNLGEDERQTALDCGAAEYLTKTNIRLEQIETIIEKYI